MLDSSALEETAVLADVARVFLLGNLTEPGLARTRAGDFSGTGLLRMTPCSGDKHRCGVWDVTF